MAENDFEFITDTNERSTIKFRYVVGLKFDLGVSHKEDRLGLENIFFHITGELDCRIIYKLSRKTELLPEESFHIIYNPLINREEDIPFVTHLGLRKLKKGVEINGVIAPSERYRREGAYLLRFGCINSLKYPSEISGIKFFATPGYEIAQLQRGEVRFWDDTRREVFYLFQEEEYL